MNNIWSYTGITLKQNCIKKQPERVAHKKNIAFKTYSLVKFTEIMHDKIKNTKEEIGKQLVFS